jgi:hypothetical protein
LKNHWLESYRKKLGFFWTAEFTEFGSFILRPRRIELGNAGAFTWSGPSQGRVSIIFNSILQTNTDTELTNFLNFSQRRMSGWQARLRKYRNTFNADELEVFYLDGLNFHSIGAGFLLTDVKVTFDYSNIRYYSLI